MTDDDLITEIEEQRNLMVAVRSRVNDDRNVIVTRVEIVVQERFYPAGGHVALSTIRQSGY